MADILTLELRQDFVRLIAKYTGLKIKESDQSVLGEKIALRMKALKLELPERYYSFLDADTPESDREWKNLVILLTNLESYFFRDKGQFSLLRNYIIPDIIARKEKQNNKTIRIASAGCSTGEEPYSLAILLNEIMPDLEDWKVLILGLDINQDALSKARKGNYGQWSFRSVDSAIISRYFTTQNNQYSISHKIRGLVKFENLNLVQSNFPSANSEMHNMDLIICRNVFIYFEQKAIEKVLDKFYNSLELGGYLMTGHAEISAHNMSKFDTKGFPESLVYQRKLDGLPSENVLTITPTIPEAQSSVFEILNNISIPGFPSPQTTNSNGKTDNIFNNLPLPVNPSHTFASKIEQQKKPFVWDTVDSIKDEKIQADGNKNEVLLSEAETLFEQKSYDLALEKINLVLKDTPKNFNALLLKAKVYANRGKYDEAFNYAKEASSVDSFSVKPHYLMSQIAEEQGKLNEAKNILKKIIYLEPSSIHAYFALSHIYQQEGDKPRMVKMQEAALDILKKMPSHTIIPEEGNVSAGDLLTRLQAQLK